MTGLQSAKTAVMRAVDLERDALHIYVGLALFLGAALLRRWPVTSWKPLAVVLVVTIIGEVWDWRDAVADERRIPLAWQWHDVWNTMFWPLVLVVLARTTRVFKC